LAAASSPLPINSKNQTTGDKMNPHFTWTDTKPQEWEDCTLVCASFIKARSESYWHYNMYQILYTHSDEGWYWAVFQDETEWGDLADLQADKYIMLPPLPHPQITKTLEP
jgi:hypothetical protein